MKRAADFVADIMNHTERKAIELVPQIVAAVAVVLLEVAGTVGELGPIEIEGEAANFGIVEHVIDLIVVGKVGESADLAGSFAMILGLAVIDSDGRVVHAEFPACIGKVGGFESEVQQ